MIDVGRIHRFGYFHLDDCAGHASPDVANRNAGEELRAKMAVGIGQLDRGESFDEEAVFDEVEAEIRRIELLSNQG